jgi:hypothetical protein
MFAMMLKRKFFISLLILATAASASYAQDSVVRAEIRENESGLHNVYIVDGSTIINITNFKNPHHIYSAKISPSQKWLLVTHMDYKPLKLAVYDLSSFKLVKRIEPGHGGHFYWTAVDTILHYWGCGSACILYMLYDNNLNTILAQGTTGITISPGRDKMITFPSTAADDEGIILYYFDNFNKKHSISIDNLTSVARIIWIDNNSVTIEYYHKNGERLQITKQLPSE